MDSIKELLQFALIVIPTIGLSIGTTIILIAKIGQLILG